jgi:hypothetical protein
MPEPGVREQEWALAAAHRAFEAGRFEQALGAFESAARDAGGPLPADALVRWGIAASESGWPLTAYFRLRQYLDARPEAVDRAALQARLSRAGRMALRAASMRSRVVALLETPGDGEGERGRHPVRLVARDGRAAVEALRPMAGTSPGWERAGDMPVTRYLELVQNVLDTPAVWAVVPPTPRDPDMPGPRGAATLRLVVGDEEWTAEASRGPAREALVAVVTRVLDFARSVALFP